MFCFLLFNVNMKTCKLSVNAGTFNTDANKHTAEQTPLILYHHHSSITEFDPQLLL